MESLEPELTTEFIKAIERARRAWKMAHLESDINKSEFFTLMMLRSKGKHSFSNIELREIFEPMMLSDLSKVMKQTMPAVSQRITKLEKLGYVKRMPDKNDKRAVWITLTNEGLAILEKAHKIMVQHLEHIMAFMRAQDPQSVENLINSCNCLADAINKEFES